MIRTYVINVNTESEKLAKINHSLSSMNIGFKRVMATTPKDVARITIKSSCDLFYPSMLPLACLVSHLKALMKFLSDHEHNDHALILEDDATPAPNLSPEKLMQILTSGPSDHEILQLGTSHLNGSKALLAHRKKSNLIWHNWHYPMWGTYAYLITSHGASKLIKRLFPKGELDLRGIYCPELCVTDYLFYDICKSYTSTYPWLGHLSLESSVRKGSIASEEKLIFERNRFLHACWNTQNAHS